MKNCCILNCPSRKRQKELSLYEFPNDIKLRRKWMNSIPILERTDIVGEAFICELHFQNNDFIFSEGRRILKKYSVPTKFSTVSNSRHSSYAPGVGIQDETYPNKCFKRGTTISTQTVKTRCKFLIKLENINKELNRDKVSNFQEIQKLTETIADLERELKGYKTKESDCLENKLHKAIDIIELDAKNTENEHAKFILEQVGNYGNDCPTWEVQTNKKCAFWYFASPKGYEHVLKEKLLSLPSKSSLSTYFDYFKKWSFPSNQTSKQKNDVSSQEKLDH